MKTKQAILGKIRNFNRYYTKLLGLLDNHLLDSKYSLAEARILYEIHDAGKITASEIMCEMNIDKGYLSKILKDFEQTGLISKHPFEKDRRVTLLSLTNLGKATFDKLNAVSNQQVESLISRLDKDDQKKLTIHMQAIIDLLSPRI